MSTSLTSKPQHPKTNIVQQKCPLPKSHSDEGSPGTFGTLVGPQAPALGACPRTKETILNSMEIAKANWPMLEVKSGKTDENEKSAQSGKEVSRASKNDH